MILVVGATGTLGGMVTRRLLEAGEPVRALVREFSDHAPLEEAGAELVFGDLKDRASLERACAGMTKVICTATAAGRPTEKFESVDRQGVGALIDMAESAVVERFVFVSAYGFEAMDAPLARAKVASEARLKDSAMTWSILKPAPFMEVWIGWVIGGQLGQGPKVAIVGDGEKPLGFVSVADVATMCVAALGRHEAENATIPLIGDVATYNQVIAAIGRTTGIEIEVEHLAPGEGPPGYPPLIADLWYGLLDQDYEVTGDVLATYGIDPVTVEAFVGKAFGAGAAGPAGH